MKRLALLLLLPLAACSKKEDAPPAQMAHIGGIWTGTGTDDAIGFYNIQLDITQAGAQASGTFSMASNVGNISGNVFMSLAANGALTGLSLSPTGSSIAVAGRVCGATMTLHEGTGGFNATKMQYGYNMSDCHSGMWNGGASLNKLARNN